MSTPSPYIRSLLTIAFPLIISGLASNLSIFIDRAILSHFDIAMMSHVSTVSNYCWMVLYLSAGVPYVSKVFVGRFNGSKQYPQVAETTWQMIFFSISCILLFIPFYFSAAYLLPTIAHQHGLIYFKTIMLGGILWPLTASLCSFFIGTYQIKTILHSLLIANASNIILDLLWIPIMGTFGAALATVISMFIQLLFLLTVFFNTSNQRQYHTLSVSFNLKLLLSAVKIGYPESLSHFFEMMAWAVVITIISSKGNDYMLISNLAQTMFILFMFVYTEIGNAVKAMCSNYLGEDKESHIPTLIYSSLTIHAIFILSITSITFIFPSIFIHALSLDHETLYFQTMVIRSLKGVFLFMLFDGIAYILASVLAAYGDTFASMLIMTVNMWLFLVLPTYILIHKTVTTAATHSLYILPFYGLITAVCYVWRLSILLNNHKSVIVPKDTSAAKEVVSTNVG